MLICSEFLIVDCCQDFLKKNFPIPVEFHLSQEMSTVYKTFGIKEITEICIMFFLLKERMSIRGHGKGQITTVFFSEFFHREHDCGEDFLQFFCPFSLPM